LHEVFGVLVDFSNNAPHLQLQDILNMNIRYGKTYVCHASKSLPCILFQAHDKEVICRAFFYRAHDNEKMHGKQALCRAPEKRTTQILFAASSPPCMSKSFVPFHTPNK
jgi:hypothetical protein